MQPAPPRRFLAWIGAILVQMLIWGVLTVAFAALLKLAGPQSWGNALYFAGLNWLPWAVLAPAVFWFSGRFPIERGYWLRSIPAHALACVACVAVTLWVSTSFGFPTRPAPRPDEQAPALSERPRRDSERERWSGSGAPRGDRPDRFNRGGPREPFGRRGPFWWPFLGATLLRANFDAAIYFIVVVAAHAIAFYRRAQERERHAVSLAASLNEAKLDALRLQLQPHFLFNTLNAISTLVHRDAHAADNLIGDLSDLLRLSLQTAEHQVPLARELELLDRYLAIEQTRLGDRLRVVRDIDPTTLEALVPTFLLQPLVENAIRHGIEPRLAPGTVTLSAQKIAGQLRLTVADDGIGLSAAANAGDARRGIGISNTEDRIHTLHGKDGHLSIEAIPTGGVRVQITLPLVTKVTAKAANALGATNERSTRPRLGAAVDAPKSSSDDGGTLELLH